jgi:hypothetical protein
MRSITSQPVQGAGRSILAVRLKRVFARPSRGIAPDLDACMKAADGTGDEARTVNISERLVPLEARNARQFSARDHVRQCAQTVEALRQFASRRPNPPLLTGASWQQLQAAGIALISPHGDKTLTAIT